MRLGVAETLERISKEDKKIRVQVLRDNASPGLQAILKYIFDPKIEFDLPEGAPPYKPSEFLDNQTMMWNEIRRLYLFTKGGNDSLKKQRKEALFIGLLESVMPEDAKLLIAMKDKKCPYKGLTRKIVDEALPGLIDG